MYGTLSDANTYHSNRGNTTWTGSDPDKTAALVRATAYIDGRYRHYSATAGSWSMFGGTKAGGRSQEEEWPRDNAKDTEGNDIPNDEVPREAEYATYEAALRELVNPGSLSPDYVAAERVKREKVDVIEVEYFDQPKPDNGPGRPLPPNYPVIPVIDGIIAPLLVVPFRRYAAPFVV